MTTSFVWEPIFGWVKEPEDFLAVHRHNARCRLAAAPLIIAIVVGVARALAIRTHVRLL